MYQTSHPDQNISEREKYLLFLSYRPTVIFAIKRAYHKFDAIPLEIEDLEFYAWEAYLDLLGKYHQRQMRKSFSSCLVDAIYWKTLNVCSKYVSNKFKVVNNSMRTSNYMQENYQKNKHEKDEQQSYVFAQIGWDQLLENYFSTKSTPIAKTIFLQHTYGVQISQIAKEAKYSIAKTRSILHKTVKDLKEIIDKEVLLN